MTLPKSDKIENRKSKWALEIFEGDKLFCSCCAKNESELEYKFFHKMPKPEKKIDFFISRKTPFKDASVGCKIIDYQGEKREKVLNLQFKEAIASLKDFLIKDYEKKLKVGK